MQTTTPSSPDRARPALVAFGLVLAVIGLGSWLGAQGSVHPTAFIPLALGVVALGVAMFSDGRPKLAWGVGAFVAALGLFGGGSALAAVPSQLVDGSVSLPVAARAATAAASVLFLAALALALVRRR